ncbi:Trypanosome RHS [Trypanosoma melophagium]|uniref:Trypanosome RHS n=1 Tax=Trypanosoma melophagium TaxID=715481 RepID=UPI00351A0A18|nr:Trypanosome RHS [Trypanosoma melophagium]
MNCPTLRDIKAMCAWEKRNQSNELENYWKKIKERIDNVGPLPRYIFSDVLYPRRCKEVKKALSDISESALFTDKGILIAEKFEEYGVNAFREGNFVSALGEELKIIQPPGIIEGKRSVLQRRDSVAYASKGYLRFPTGTNDEEMRRIEYNMLYHPSISNFPLVDAFYFVKSAEGRVTLIGIQTTTARDHETTVTAVSGLKEYLETCFSDWADISKEVSWEIIYMQPKVGNESKQIRRWQGCILNESEEYTIEEQKVVAAFWNEKVNQYQVNLSPEMILRVALTLEAMDSRIIKFIREKGKS